MAAALLKRDTAALTRLPGVGKKLAERLGVELSDKVKSLGLDLNSADLAQAPGAQNFGGPWEQAVSALIALGFGQSQAKNAVSEAHKGLGNGNVSLEDIVKAALKAV